MVWHSLSGLPNAAGSLRDPKVVPPIYREAPTKGDISIDFSRFPDPSRLRRIQGRGFAGSLEVLGTRLGSGDKLFCVAVLGGSATLLSSETNA